MGGHITSDLWATLDASLAGPGLVRLRVAPEAPLDIFAAVEHPTGVRLLQFGLPGVPEARSLDVSDTRAINVRAIPSATEAGWGVAEVRLVDPRYADIFTTLADDLVSHIGGAVDADSAVDRIVDRLRRWVAFLQVIDPEGLSSERRAALYGELHILRARLLPIGVEIGIGSWVGPSGAQQDFQASNWALEVKTSRTKEPVAVRISGERQLDDGGLAFLGLAHVGLEQRRLSGETLPEIVGSIRTMVADKPQAEQFEAQLFAAGYSNIHESRYRDQGYVVRFDELFHVRHGFPRLLERDLVRGVGDIAYSIAASALGPFAMTWSDFTARIRSGAYD
jgi:hypothetical protein